MEYSTDLERDSRPIENGCAANGWLLVILAYLFGGELIQKAVLTLIRSRFAVPYKLDAIAIYGLIAYAALQCFHDVVEEFPAREMLVFLALGISFLVSWAVTIGYEDMFLAMIPDFLMGVVGYIFFRCVRDWKSLLNCFAKLSIVMTVSLAVYLRLIGGLERYSMYLGYLVLGGVVTSGNEMIRRGSILHTANTAFGLALLLSMGARGPVACMLAFLVIRIVFDIGRNRRSLFALLVIAIAAFALFQNFDTVVDTLIGIFDRAHLSLRALQKLQNTEFLSSNARLVRMNNAVEIIKEHLFTGVGIGRDRISLVEIGQGIDYNPLKVIGNYAHNPFLELWMQFGVIIGSGFILLMLKTIFDGLFSSGRSRDARDVVLIMLFVGFVPLLVSDSYFTRPEFFCTMAICRAAVMNGSMEPA